MTLFKHLVTGKKQPGGPARETGDTDKGKGRGKSSHTLEEVKKLETGATAAKKPRHSDRNK